MKSSVFVILIMLLFSCNSKDKNQVLDMRDITPKSERQTADSLSDIELDNQLILPLDTAVFQKSGIQVTHVRTFESPLFADRFSPVKIKKYVLDIASDSLIYCQWVFRDSTHTKNALFNILDCFGPHCKSVKIGQAMNLQKDNFLMFVNDTSISYISGESNLKSKEWVAYFKAENELENWPLLLLQPTRGKTRWYKVQEGKELVFTPQETLILTETNKKK